MSKRVLPILQISSILEIYHQLFSVISRTLVGGVLPLCREAVGVFYSPSWLGKRRMDDDGNIIKSDIAA